MARKVWTVAHARQWLHMASTVLFLLSVAYVLVYALRLRGTQWWVIFSLSAPSLTIAFFLVCVYLLAIYRGAARRSLPEIEHPLTSSSYYMIMYDVSPIMGFLAGIFAMWGTTRPGEYGLGVSYGVFTGTFLVWIVVDPLLGFVESALPQSRAHRQRRLAEQRRHKKEQQRRRDAILSDVLLRLRKERESWKETFAEQAGKLAELMHAGMAGNAEDCQPQAIDLGVAAWRTGGMECMKTLHTMAHERYRLEFGEEPQVDHLSRWWDGVGDWRQKAFSEVYSLG